MTTIAVDRRACGTDGPDSERLDCGTGPVPAMLLESRPAGFSRFENPEVAAVHEQSMVRIFPHCHALAMAAFHPIATTFVVTQES